MKYTYNVRTGLTRVKTNTKKYAVAIIASFALAGSVALPAMAAPTTGPEAGPGCFGQWRAGSVQVINEGSTAPAGKNYFAVRAGDNSTINADNRATCDAL